MNDDTRAAPIAAAASHFLLRPDIAFLNHGSYGACPRPVFDTYQRWQRELQSQPVEFLARRRHDLFPAARGQLAAYVGAHADNIVFIPNATVGCNIVAHSLHLAPGDEVLGTSHEYGAVERTWRFMCQRQGAHYRAQRISVPVTDAEAMIAELWQGVTERTRVLVVSHITSPTALIFPLAAICRRASAQGIITVVDGAHAPGQLDLDLDSLGADFYFGNCHKWLCAPVGSGFLYARPERQALLEPLVVSFGWQADSPSGSPFQDYFEWSGTFDPAAWLSVPAAIRFQEENDWDTVRARAHELLREAHSRISELTGLPPLAPDSTEWWLQMCSLPLPISGRAQGEELKRNLWDRFQVEAPVVNWNETQLIRVSAQAYNSPRDIDRLIEGLSRLL
ncbi:MAG TPA: aminotransferase class V-fold PLP-dependent enzyme [Ktedonobacterales bacterium]